MRRKKNSITRLRLLQIYATRINRSHFVILFSAFSCKNIQWKKKAKEKKRKNIVNMCGRAIRRVFEIKIPYWENVCGPRCVVECVSYEICRDKCLRLSQRICSICEIHDGRESWRKRQLQPLPNVNYVYARNSFDRFLSHIQKYAHTSFVLRGMNGGL